MTKAQLIQNVADRLKLPVSQAEMVVSSIFDSMYGCAGGRERAGADPRGSGGP